MEYKIGQIFETDYQRHLLKRVLIYRGYRNYVLSVCISASKVFSLQSILRAKSLRKQNLEVNSLNHVVVAFCICRVVNEVFVANKFVFFMADFKFESGRHQNYATEISNKCAGCIKRLC